MSKQDQAQYRFFVIVFSVNTVLAVFGIFF